MRRIKCPIARSRGLSQRSIGRQPPARRREVEAVRPPRRAPGEEKDFAPIGPDAKVGPEARAVDLNGPLGDPSLRDIGLALPQEPTQPPVPDRGAVDEPAARKSMPGLEDEVGFAPRQHLRVVGAQDMRLRDVGAQDPPFVRLDPEVANGPGIAAEDIARLGRPFEQGDVAMADGMKGSGLGLAIANSLVELHGGTLRLGSREGEGAVAVVALPRVQRGPRAVALAKVA